MGRHSHRTKIYEDELISILHTGQNKIHTLFLVIAATRAVGTPVICYIHMIALSMLRELARRAALMQLNLGEVRDRSLPSLIKTHFERWAPALSVAMAKTGSALIMGAASLVPPSLPTDGSLLGGGGGPEGRECFPPTGQEAPRSATVVWHPRGAA